MYAIKDSKYYLKRTNCIKEYWSYFFDGDYKLFVCVPLTFNTKAIQYSEENDVLLRWLSD